MFNSWGIEKVSATAALTLYNVLYNVARLAAPAAGFLILLALSHFSPVHATVALVCGLLALLLAGCLAIVMRWEAAARFAGRTAGSVAHRFRPSKVDVPEWEEAAVAYRRSLGHEMHGRAVPAFCAQATILAVEVLLFVVCVRATGTSPAAAVTVEVIAAFLVAYPLTALPLYGLGILEAAVLILLGDQIPVSEFTTGMVVWRVATFLLPTAAGALALWHWRRSTHHQQPRTPNPHHA